MIIELFGISGVGKTTIAKQMIFNNKELNWPTYDLYESNKWLKRNIIKLKGVLNIALIDYSFYRKIINILKKINVQKKDFYSLLFNSLYLKYTQKSNSKKYCLYDEGVFQLIWAYCQRTSSLEIDFITKSLLELYDKPSKLIIITAKSEDIARRIIKRGEYTRIMDSKHLVHRINELKKIQDIIVNIAVKNGFNGKIEYINNKEKRVDNNENNKY